MEEIETSMRSLCGRRIAHKHVREASAPNGGCRMTEEPRADQADHNAEKEESGAVVEEPRSPFREDGVASVVRVAKDVDEGFDEAEDLVEVSLKVFDGRQTHVERCISRLADQKNDTCGP